MALGTPFSLKPEVFDAAQVLLIAGGLFLVLRFTRAKESRFRPDSGTRRRTEPVRSTKDEVRQLMQGVVLTGLPHQILGVRADASEFEIRKAHRTLIKRFHPDKVGPEGSRAWHEAQRASEAINGARDEMLKALSSAAQAGTKVE